MQIRILQLVWFLIFVWVSPTTLFSQWTKLDAGTDLWLRGVDFVSQTTGIVVGYDGLILLTDNGGASWEQKSSGTDLDLLGVQYADQEVIYITGSLGIVLKSIDAGQTWTIVKEGGAVTHECFFLNKDLGYIAGEGGQVFKTLDGGMTWNRLPVGIGGKVALHFFDEDLGYFVGLGNRDAILKTETGGLTFESINSLGYQEFSSVYFTSPSNGFVLNIGGQRIVKTEDGGNSWQDAMSNTGARMYDITFADDRYGQAVGGFPDRSVILRTEDAGLTWIQENSGVTSPLFDSKMINDSYGFAVGMDGTILRRGDVPVSAVSIARLDIKIFPNPTVDFLNIESTSYAFQTYSIYNLLGHLVSHRNFDSLSRINIMDLASGLYLIRLSDGVETYTTKFEKM